MIRIEGGLPDHLRDEAAVLYWAAFGEKLGRVLGPERLALVFFARVMRADHCLTAYDREGRLVGLAGFKTERGTFAGGTEADLRAVYGTFGGRWRAMAVAGCTTPCVWASRDAATRRSSACTWSRREVPRSVSSSTSSSRHTA